MIKKVWQNTCFRWCSIVKNLKEGGLLIPILIPGLVLAFFYWQYEQRAISLGKKVDKALTESWKQAPSGDLYLNVYFETGSFPIAFGKEDVFGIVGKKLNVHNYQVRAVRNNRKVGLYEKKDAKLEHKVRAIYSENIVVNGKKEPTIWLISENTYVKNEELKKELEKKGEKLPLKE